MLNASEPVLTPPVIDYADAKVAHAMANGRMNTTDEKVLENIAYAIRRGHMQWRTGPIRHDRICLVGSGPTLADTFDELRQMIWEGATLVTMNGAYQYCIDRGLKPQTQIVMDARSTNARFVTPAVPKCNYVLASQCDKAVWDAVEGRPHVWIFHAVVKKEGDTSEMLDRYYGGNWVGIGGGTTVATRAISLLRIAGYLRFDLFGIDCCWKDKEHHAMPQPENERDRRIRVRAGVKDDPTSIREFFVAPWMLKQAEDFLTTMKANGQHFVLMPHGDGLLTHLITTLGTSQTDNLLLEKETDEHGGSSI